jgi:penicillin-binding protein 1A
VVLTSLKPRLARLRARLRRPTRREWLWAIGAIPALVLLYVLILIPFTPGISDIRKAKVDQPARILSADGKLLTEFKWANREWVPLKQVSPNVVAALIATEDHRFYIHHGIDWRRTASAALHTFSGNRQGGSTITQQLARNLYPEEIGRAPSLTRKIKEAITAFKIEALYTKDEILETYLNTVPFLYNAYGIEMAARTYFGKSANELDVLESATLIGMLKGNSYYNPVINPERAQQRRNLVLEQMAKYQKLAPAKLAALQKRPLALDFERQIEPPGPVAHFSQQLRKWLIAWADKNDYDIYSDGLVVYTTIDSRLQNAANQAVAHQTNQLQAIANAVWANRGAWHANLPLVQSFIRETPEYHTALAGGQTPEQALKQLQADGAFMHTLRQQKIQLQAGFLALDPRDGAVRAWVGSRDFASEPFDHVQQAKRQPGSTFKPFVYGAAFAQGASPDDKLLDQEVDIPVAGHEVWHPTDETPPTNRPMSLRDGLVYSKNIITAQLVQKVGVDKVADLAYAMGVRQSKLERVPSLALGTSPVSLREMVTAYATIANDGSYIEPMFVTRIEDRHGKVLETFKPATAEPALDRNADRILLDVMRGVVDRGTGAAIRSRYGIRADVAGKTGTTQDNTDGWFILMHPQLVAGAWVGFNDSRITLRSDYWGQGAHSALPVVGSFFQRALALHIIDPHSRFDTQTNPGWFHKLLNWSSGWMGQIFGNTGEDTQSAPASSRPSAPQSPVAMPEAASQPQPGANAQSIPIAETSAIPGSVSTPAATASAPITAASAPSQSEPVASQSPALNAHALERPAKSALPVPPMPSAQQSQ